MENQTTTFENCTIYTSGEFMGNYSARKCKWVKVHIGPYAQYNNAVHVTYLEKGKRNPRGFVQAYKPSLVIAKGWDTPKPPDLFTNTLASTEGVTMQQATYRSFDTGWQNDFENQVLPKLKVLANYHNHDS